MTVVEELRTDRERGARRLESEYKAGLMTLARRFCADEGDAEELVNRTLAAVVEGIDDYLEQSAFFGWMCKILENIHAKDVRRKSNRTVVGDAAAVDGARDDEARDRIFREVDASLLRDAIADLPADMKEALMLRYFMDLPVSRVARILSAPEGTVKWRLHCARMMLAAKLGARSPGVRVLVLGLLLAAGLAIGGALYTLGAAVFGSHAESAEVVSHAENAESAESVSHAENAECAESVFHAENAESVSHAENAENAESAEQTPSTSSTSSTPSTVSTPESSEMNAKPLLAAASLALAAGAQAENFGNETTTIDGDIVVKFTSSGTFVIDQAVTARILVVGGGGAGGTGIGGGGGGGGVVETNGYELAAGSYAVVVGAGGEPRDVLDISGRRGGNGGASSFGAFPDLVALGGGGGGSSGSGNGGGSEAAGAGGAGIACGGGAGKGSDANAVGTQGGNGGAAFLASGADGVGGGGGAGADGGDAVDNRTSGAGGDGLPSDITGSEVWYGGGGGAGNGNSTPNGSAGGRGGGANGNLAGVATAGAAGTAGLGGGGAGGSNSQADPAARLGGAGGSGVVIVRYSVPLLVFFEDSSVSDIGATTLTLSATLRLLGSAAPATAEVWLGTGASAGSLVWETVDGAAAEGDTVSRTLTGLAEGTLLFYRWRVVSGGETLYETDVLRTSTNSEWPSMLVVEPGVADELYTATDRILRFRTNGTLRVEAGGVVRALLVGGGGAGGTTSGGGGGAGGFVERSGLVIPAGDYAVEVGAGGIPGDGQLFKGHSGGDGGATRIGSLLEALGGGGGGGGRGADPSWCSGRPGGSAGGNAEDTDNSVRPAGTPGQGTDGGFSNHEGSGGGGGAGGRGYDAFSSIHSAPGGRGLPSDITGGEVWYAGGGGGGNGMTSDGTFAWGGRGGGGGTRRPAGEQIAPPAGENGLGGGGAGGGGGSWSADLQVGGAGGSGIAIIRFRASGAWTYGLRAASRGSSSLSIAGSVGLAGPGAPASIAAQVGVAPAAGGAFAWQSAGSGLAAGGSFSATVGGLDSSTAYRVRARLLDSNGATIFESGDLAVSTTGGRLAAVAESDAEDGVELISLRGGQVAARFTTNGTFTVTHAGTARVLLVGGGGGGGLGHTGGGGGGGGFVEVAEVDLAPGVYDVIVGAGGAGGRNTVDNGRGGMGGDSSFAGLIARGGGAGGTSATLGRPGGCGGGHGGSTESWQLSMPPVGLQGGDGGLSRIKNNNGDWIGTQGGGGGGGAGGDGTTGEQLYAGDGGDGRVSDITGAEVWYAGGGGGGCGNSDPYMGAAGKGGGGGAEAPGTTRRLNAAIPGTNGLGGGGSGGTNGTDKNGGSGGSGVVIIRWSIPPPGTIIIVR